jgi:GTP-binding protein
LIGRRKAIVEDIPGTTRDRLTGEVRWKGHVYNLVDTGGLDVEAEGGYPALIRDQVVVALSEADVILMVVDAVSGITPGDRDVAELLRRSERPVILAANKGDNPQREELAVEFFELGLGEPMIISAYHGLGTHMLQDRITESLPRVEDVAALSALGVAIVGRPNVGKSSLVNAILEDTRVIESPEAGTTRDAVDTPFVHDGKAMVLVDTAGIRRPGKISRGIEKYSVMRAGEAIERSDVVVVMIDAEEGLTQQDLHIVSMVIDAAKGLVVTVNKWDLVEDSDENRDRVARRILARMKFAPWAPLAFVSAKTGLNIEGLLDLLVEIGDARATRIATSELNSALREAVATHPPPATGKRRLHLKYVTQTAVNPPTFVVFCNNAALVHFSYRRFLENQFRSRFGFEGTVMKFQFRSQKD